MQESALLKAYLEHEKDLLRFLVRRLGSASLAADIAQDLFLKLHRGESDGVRDSRTRVTVSFGRAVKTEPPPSESSAAA